MHAWSLLWLAMEKTLTLFVFIVVTSSSFISLVTTQAPEPTRPDLPGPCRAWVFPCGHSWTCTSEQEYQQFRLGPQPLCPVMPVNSTQSPPPGRCEIVDGTCQFTTSTLQCTSWVNSCQFHYQCGTVEEHAAYLNSSSNHCGTFRPLPKPNSLCLPINNTCQWYNPCASWRGHCLSGYNCGTADEYYAFLYGPQPRCAQPPPGWTEPLPPGECQLDNNMQCSWSNCTSWLGICMFNWYCDTEYQQQVYDAQPPPPCPAPPPNYTPPPPPGVCKYDLLDERCHYEPVTEATDAEVQTTSPVTTQAPEPIQPNLSGPCRAWVFPCGHSWTCTSEQEYQQFRLGPQPLCPVMPVNSTQSPPPGRCEIVDGTCQFINSTFQCTSWINTYQVTHECGSIEEHTAYLNGWESRYNNTYMYGPPFPKVNSLCLPINNTCQWYNPCAYWRGHCSSGYNCGTADEYYAFLYGPQPLCAQPPPGWTEPLPPGKCQLDSNMQCSWSNCTSWLGNCLTGWYCDTVYQKQLVGSRPPPPCPPPPGNYTPPPPPAGVCEYNLLQKQCRYEPVTTTTAEPPTCSGGKEYRECGPLCPETCDTINGLSPCFSLRCGSPGCYCPTGTVLHQDRCIEPLECPTENPCALIDCLPHHTCQVDPSTGEGGCIPSCDIDNGGCRSDELCVVKEYGIMCFEPPYVYCSSEDNIVNECPVNSRCLVQNVTKEVSCIPSCFINNGGCSDDVCVSYVTNSDCRRSCTTDTRCLQLGQLSRKCPAGMEYSECGSYCEPSCETQLSQEIYACAAVCISGCFCPRGLVMYRDRCVDPKECYSLMQDPPPLNPLPIKSSTVLISMSVDSMGIDEFDEIQQPLLDAITDLLENKGYNVEVTLHAIYMGNQNQLNVAFEVSGKGISMKNAETIAALLSSNTEVLPVEVRSISIVPTQVQPDGIVLSTGAIVGIVIGCLVVIVTVFVIMAVSMIVVIKKKKHLSNVSKEMNAKETPVSYSKLEFEHEDSETTPSVSEPLPEKPNT